MRGWLIVSNDEEQRQLSKILTIHQVAEQLCISVAGLRSRMYSGYYDKHPEETKRAINLKDYRTKEKYKILEK